MFLLRGLVLTLVGPKRFAEHSVAIRGEKFIDYVVNCFCLAKELCPTHTVNYIIWNHSFARKELNK